MAAIRLQVTLNGRKLCIAGMDEHGTLSVTVEFTRVPGVKDPFRPSEVPADETHDELRVAAQTLFDDELRWVAESIKPGDEITICVLGPGTPDAPAERIPCEIF